MKLPKWFSGTVIRICLSLPSIVYRVFLRKIKYLAKLLVDDSKSNSSRVFVSATIADPVNVSLIQQCKMLESIIGVSLVNHRGGGAGPADPAAAGPIISACDYTKALCLRCHELNCGHGCSTSQYKLVS